MKKNLFIVKTVYTLTLTLTVWNSVYTQKCHSFEIDRQKTESEVSFKGKIILMLYMVHILI